MGEFPLKWLHKAPFFSIIADECTDVTTIEELIVLSGSSWNTSLHLKDGN